jgi:hypothetical protein
MNGLDFKERLDAIVAEIELAENFSVIIGQDNTPEDQWGRSSDRFYFQIMCWRKDVVTGKMGRGFGGKAYLSKHATDSELVQTVFGLYKGYWEHESRETFQWRGRRVFGPHIDTEALWEIANRTDARKPVDS